MTEQVEDGRRDVDHVHEAVAPTGRRTEQRRACTPGARMPGDREPRTPPRRRRTHHEHRVVRRVDVGEHAADELVDAVQGGLLLDTGLVVGEEVGVEIGAQQVASPRPARRRPCCHDVARRRGTRRRCPCARRRARAGRVASSSSPTAPPGTRPSLSMSALTAARWNSGSGSSTTGWAPSPLAMTARGTVCSREGVTERADRRVVEAVGVLLHQRVDARGARCRWSRRRRCAAGTRRPGGAVAVGLGRARRPAAASGVTADARPPAPSAV